MPGPFDYLIWSVGFVAEAIVIICSLRRREFLRFLPLNIYLILTAAANFGTMYFCIKSGVHSTEYFIYYYVADLVLGVSLYYVIVHLYQMTLADFKVARYIRAGAFLVLALTCFFSYRSVHGDKGYVSAHFVGQLEQNLNFVGVVLTYLLWGAIMKLRETRTRLVQLILALGIYFSAIAAVYALRALFPQYNAEIWRWAPPVIGTLLPVAWSYAFLKIPSDAQLLTSQVALSPR